MKLAVATLSSLALAALAGCATQAEPVATRTTTVTTTSGTPATSASQAPVTTAVPTPSGSVSSSTSATGPQYRQGSGIIESVSLVTLPATAAAGGTLPPVVQGPYRYTVRMDDGTIQTVLLDARTHLVGDRVQITSDGRLMRP